MPIEQERTYGTAIERSLSPLGWVEPMGKSAASAFTAEAVEFFIFLVLAVDFLIE